MKQPLFNSTHKNFTKRDSLGLQNISSSIQAWVCPIINVVTPHPFYWAFLVWNYYHFYSQPQNKNASDSEFNNYVKRNDFYFVLCNHLVHRSENIVGKDNMQMLFPDKEFAGPYYYNEKYYQSHFGGMQYYNFGALKFLPENLRPIRLDSDFLGARLTRAFDEGIKSTAYYRNYISQNIVPDGLSREELIELSDHLKLTMDNMPQVKEIIYHTLFATLNDKGEESFLSLNEQYLKLLINNGLLDSSSSFSGWDARKILFADNHPLILDKLKAPEAKMKTVITRWEIVIANQYYVSCMEMIWKYLLSVLSGNVSLEQWIDEAINSSNNIDISAPLSSIKNNLSFKEIESSIKKNVSADTIYSALSIIMSIVNRFKNRVSDFDYIPLRIQEEFCILSLCKKIYNDDFNNIGEFIYYLAKYTIIERHEYKATEKQYQGRDGFMYEKIYGLYFNRGDDYMIEDISRPGLRLTNVLSVLKDLGKI